MTNQYQWSSFLKPVNLPNYYHILQRKHPLKISIVDVMNMQYYMDKLKKVLISNINKHHWKTIDSYFLSVSYGVDIIMGLYIYKLHIV